MQLSPLIEITQEVKIFEVDEKAGRDLYLEGITLQAEVVNANKRMYPKNVLRESVEAYTKKYLQDDRAVGELNHPMENISQINPDRISHKFVSIIQDGNNFITKAKVLNTTCGQQVRNLVEGGVKIGMSSRGFGKTRKENDIIIVENLHLVTLADIVIDPSAPDAFQQAVYERKEWLYQNGVLVERDVEPIIDQTNLVMSSRFTVEERNAMVVKMYENYLKTIKLPVKIKTFGEILRT